MRAIARCLVLAITLVFVLNGCKDEKGNVTPSSPSQQESGQMVYTPFGYVDKSKVFHIEEQYAVRVDGDKVVKIDKETKEVVAVLGDAGPKQSSKSSNSGGRMQSGDPFGSSTLTQAQATASPTGTLSYTTFVSWITMPLLPASNSETFYFGEKQDIFGNVGATMAAVYQYGPSVAGGGNYWSAACWLEVGSVVTHSGIHTNITPGVTANPRIAYSSPNQYFAETGFSGNSLSYFESLWTSDLYFFASGENLSGTNTYFPPVYSLNFRQIDAHAGVTYPSLTWAQYIGSLGEHVKQVSNTPVQGEVDLCLFGNPSTPTYPNNTVYPLHLAWTGTSGADYYNISYYVIDHSGHQTNFSDTSTSTTYTFPFSSTYCKGCDLFSKVQAHYPNGVVSEFSATYNALLP
jgi:hypothetical protein